MHASPRALAYGLVLASCWLATPGRSADLVVDASGATSSLTTIDQAMATALPGDRILVLPGSYPAFLFNRGVEVVGLGASPDQVVVERVDFHVNHPTFGYDAGLSNLTICGTGPYDGTSVSGNELGAGTLVIHGVRLCGGIFLRGGGEFYLLMIDSHVDAVSGGGFQNSGLDFGGGIADLVDSKIQGPPAAEGPGAVAGVGIRVRSGAVVRISACEVDGGHGGGGAAGSTDGGDAIDRSPTGTAQLRLSGGSVIRGGAGGPGGTGGAGVDLSGSILLGDASVAGGGGQTPGPAYAASQPTLLPYDPHLRLEPSHSFASGSPFASGGQVVAFVPDASLPVTTILYAPRIDPPSSPDLSPLPPSGSHELSSNGPMGLRAPRRRDSAGSVAGLTVPARRIVYQGFCVDPITQQVVTTNPTVVASR